MNKILVVNFSAPEMNYLAAALAKADYLETYLRPYVNKSRLWERGLKRIPGFGKIIQHTLGRRLLPSGLPPSDVREIAILADFTAVGASRLGLLGVPFADKLVSELQYYIQNQLGKAGGHFVRHSSAVVASCHVALPAFRACEGLKILNYPTVHHRHQRIFVIEELNREPEFSSMLPGWNVTPEWVGINLDEEYALADRIFVGSTFARDSFIAEGIPYEKLVVIPYGVDISLFSPMPSAIPIKNCFRVLFVGQIGQRKGISYLLKAYNRFRGSGTSLTLVGDFCGSEVPLRRYKDLFRHVPNVPRALLPELYRQAEVFVFPTLLEGMAMVVLEAMASGLPVIVTPNGPGDIVRDGVDGFVVPPRDIDSIADRMEYLRSNPEVRAQMGANARKRAMEFTWETYGQNVCRIIKGSLKIS